MMRFKKACIATAIVTGAVVAGAQGDGTLSFSRLTLRELTALAYDVPHTNVDGGPAWTDSIRFDIRAKGSSDVQPVSSALRSLLAQRFGLAVRVERRERPIYRLVRGVMGGRPAPGLALSPCLRADVAATPPKSADEGLARAMAPPCGPLRLNEGSSMSAEGLTIAEFAIELSRLPEIARVVRDETGLYDVFDLQLDWTGSVPDIFTALQRQLGFRLEGDRSVVDIVVIEGAQLPTED